MKKRRSSVVIAGLAFGLAGGVLFSSYVLAPNLPGGTTSQGASAAQQREQAQADAEINAAQADSADHFVSSFAKTAVADTLKDRSILILRSADASDDDVANLQRLVAQAGGKDAGMITLSEKFFEQSGADELKTIVTNTLPAGAKLSENRLDPGTHAGEAVGSMVLFKPDSEQPQASAEERKLGLTALKEAGFIQGNTDDISPAHGVMFVVGDSNGSKDHGFAETSQAAFSQALDSRGGGIVVAGQINTASSNGVIGKIRADEKMRSSVSTVDSINRSWARIAAVIATSQQLAGKHGAYGAAANADAVSPAIMAPESAGQE